MLTLLFDYFQVKKSERPALMWACLWFATLLGGYYMVRPVREALGSEYPNKLQVLFRDVFLVMLVAVPTYARLVSRFRRRIMVPLVYRFLMINLMIFAALMQWGGAEYRFQIARVFFIWVSVYVLFAMSLFWSVMADAFTTDQARRLFGAVAGCGTAGGLIGSAFAAKFGPALGLAGFLIVPAWLMEAGLACYRNLEDCRSDARRDATLPATGGNPFAGFSHVARSPYLLTICGYVLITSLCGTSLYLAQANIVNAVVPLKNDRLTLFAQIDFAAQVLAMMLQFVVAGKLMKMSLPLSLMVLPATYLVGFALLGYRPEFAIVVGVMVAVRATTYGLTVPAQGVLFTVVTRAEKYKAKNIIDTLVTRSGDATASQIGNQLREMGVGLTALSWGILPLTAAWTLLAYLLGRRCVAKVEIQQSAQDARAAAV